MKTTPIWILLAVIILGALGWWWYSAQEAVLEAPVPEVAGENEEFVDDSKDGAAAGESSSAYTVRYTSAGFSPESLSVPLGATVTFINQGTEEMWVGSDEHPTHTQYSGTNKDEHCVNGAPSATSFDQCGVGSTYSFTFTKEGIWGYHNHRESDHHGTIVVE